MSDLTPETPAQGILKRNSWGDSMWYSVACDCGGDDHNYEVSVEADEVDISVYIYFKSHTPSKDTLWQRLRQKISVTWNIWVNGYVEQQHELYLRPQSALNFSETLRNAVRDISELRNQRSKTDE